MYLLPSFLQIFPPRVAFLLLLVATAPVVRRDPCAIRFTHPETNRGKTHANREPACRPRDKKGSFLLRCLIQTAPAGECLVRRPHLLRKYLLLATQARRQMLQVVLRHGMCWRRRGAARTLMRASWKPNRALTGRACRVSTEPGEPAQRGYQRMRVANKTEIVRGTDVRGNVLLGFPDLKV